MKRIKQILTKNKKEIVAGIVFVVSLCLFSFSYAFASTEPVRSITMTSRNTNYEDKEEGSWQVTKSGYWTGYGEAEVTLDLDTTLMTNNQYTDIIFVLDISGSMAGEKLDRVKSDSKELISSLLSNQNNRAALITFDTDSQIVSDFTHDEELLTNEIDNLQVQGNTNYYQALVNVDSILQDYQKESGREMVVLFLTDGYPNEDTPNQITQYQYLKSTYPYIIINGIQYEMGSSILNPIKEISDNQFIADMETLINVLFDASVAPVTYDNYQIIDYIDNDNFILESVNDIKVTTGSVELTEENGKQKITWTLDNLASGREANLTMKLKLNDELVGQGGVYPTNESTEVISKIENQEEDVSTINTPVLSDNYQVIYDGNAPEGCTVSNVPGSKQYSVYSTVEISDQIPTCTGYQFKGWKIATKDVTKINNNYFTMPENDVEIKAEWSKISTTKTMDGEIYVAPTLYNFMKQEAVMDNTSSEFVSSSTGINFGSRLDNNTNGKGVYIRAGTEDNEYPILYFRGDVDNNHVKFGGFCWLIVRTTETGGTKLIYDGVPDSNGYCNNTGEDSQIGKSQFNQNYESPADVGYMVGTRYEYDYEGVEWFDLVGKSEIYTPRMSGTNYYFVDSVTYRNGTYTLVNPTQYSWSDNYQNLEGKYTCRSDSATSCSEVYYVNDASSSYMYSVNMTNGETYDSLYQEASELTWVYGNDVTWNGSSYTLVDTVESKPINWSTDGTSVVGNGHRYTCMSNSDTCSTVYYVHYTGDSDTIYYMTLNNGVNISGALNEMFPEDNNLRNQKDSTIKTYIDNWYRNNMTEYTRYLEDTVWCNDRSIYQLNSWDKDYTGTSYYLYFGPFGKNAIIPYVSDLSCPSLADSFTVSSENGNGKLTYPVALLTADEITLAGSGVHGYSSSSYLNTGQYWWSLSPYYFDYYGRAYKFYVDSSVLDNYVVSGTTGVRPSVSLAPGILVSRGTGTSENPYELVLE